MAIRLVKPVGKLMKMHRNSPFKKNTPNCCKPDKWLSWPNGLETGKTDYEHAEWLTKQSGRTAKKGRTFSMLLLYSLPTSKLA